MIPRSARPADHRVLAAIDGWGASTAAAAVIDATGLVAAHGPQEAVLPWASVSKLVTGCTVLAGVARGVLSLDDPAGPVGSTVRHLLAHASGLAPDSASLMGRPGHRRIYSNAGIDLAAETLAGAAGRPFAELASDWVLRPLGMRSTRLDGRPSAGMAGSCADLSRLALELLAPRVLPADLLAQATVVAFPGLRGVLPGFGRQDPNDWGLGFEVRAAKAPHWTGTRSSPRTFGHFGQAGTFLWVDPEAGVALACLTDRAFGSWAGDVWPVLSDAVLAAAAARPAKGD